MSGDAQSIIEDYKAQLIQRITKFKKELQTELPSENRLLTAASKISHINSWSFVQAYARDLSIYFQINDCLKDLQAALMGDVKGHDVQHLWNALAKLANLRDSNMSMSESVSKSLNEFIIDIVEILHVFLSRQQEIENLSENTDTPVDTTLVAQHALRQPVDDARDFGEKCTAAVSLVNTSSMFNFRTERTKVNADPNRDKVVVTVADTAYILKYEDFATMPEFKRNGLQIYSIYLNGTQLTSLEANMEETSDYVIRELDDAALETTACKAQR